MTGSTAATAVDMVLREFESPWRDDTPVFGCCRKAVTAVVEEVDPFEIVPLDATTRVQVLRDAVERRLPGHLGTHRCCANHLADLAFDLPGLLAPVGSEVDS